MDQHALVSAVKELAIELGRTPTKQEFCRTVRGAHVKIDLFGGYTALLQAAGLETYDDRRSKGKRVLSRADVYGADIAEVVAEHKPKEVQSRPENFKPILLIGDTHFPFAHQPTLEWIYRFAEKHQPAYIVQQGDLMDQWAHSRFPASRNYYRPDEEMELGRKQAIEFWDELKRACPTAEYYQITGNHDERAIKLILNAAPTLESFVREGVKKLYEFEGVTTIHDYREALTIQGVEIHHGFFGRLGQHRDHVQRNCATAHTHKGGVSYRPLNGKTIWHLDTGFVGDAEAKALGYTPLKTTGWTLGVGWVDEYGPRFIPA